MAKRIATSEEIDAANTRMREAWETGHQIFEDLGKRSEYGHMRDQSAGNASEAEKMRKYRAMSQRITENELERICGLCLKHGRPLGPTFLVAITPIEKYTGRRELIRQTILNGWGLEELQLQVRRRTSSSETKRNVGRKRRVDLLSEVAILEQMAKLCLNWVRIDNQLREPCDNSETAGRALLPASLQSQLDETSKQVADLLKQVDERRDRPKK